MERRERQLAQAGGVRRRRAATGGKPRSRSAETTESRILKATEEVFVERGYFDATVAHIVDRARISRGAFYLYFKNRDDAFAKLMSNVVADQFIWSAPRGDGTLSERVEAGNRAFFEAFRERRHVMRTFFQAATVAPDMMALHSELRQGFVERVKHHLDRAVADGRAFPMDTEIVSFALCLMVECFAYFWQAFGFEPGKQPLDFDRVVRELSSLWCRAVYRDAAGAVAKGPPLADGVVGTDRAKRRHGRTGRSQPLTGGESPLTTRPAAGGSPPSALGSSIRSGRHTMHGERR